jgi:PAS domain S-box-containing protein
MKNSIRNSGIDSIGSVPWGTHFCQFYQNKEELKDIIIPYLKAGLESNEFCIWIASSHLEVKEAEKLLKTAVTNADTYPEKKQIEIISLNHWYIKNETFDFQEVLKGLIDKINKSLACGYDGLRLIKNTSSLENESWNNFVNYERGMNSIINKCPIIALCTYFLDTCSAVDVIEIAANHQLVLAKKEGKWEKIENSEREIHAECRQTEEALRKSEERYRMLFTNMTDGFGLLEVIYDKKGKPHDYRYLELNPAFELILGVKREQILGKTMLEVFPNVNPIAIEKYNEVALSGKPTHFEIGSEIAHKYLDIYVFSPERGKVALIIRDITERKQMEKELQESEGKYRNIVETASEGVWIGDPEARTVYVNKRLAEMLRYTQDEMIGRLAWDFASEENKLTVKKNLEDRRRGIDRSYEFKFIRKDGSPLWTIVSGKALFDNKGKFIGNMAMFTDITQRKETEEKLKSTLDNLEKLVKERTAELENAYNSLKKSEKGLAEAQKMAHVGNWEWSIMADKAYWSDELYRIFKRDPQEAGPPYNEFLNYIHPDDRDLVKNVTKESINGKPYSIECRIVRGDGEERIIHMQSDVIYDEKNNPVQIRGILQDITEYQRMEDALRQNEELLSAFLEQLPVGTGLVDPHGRLLVNNSMFRRFISNVIPSQDSENSWRWRAWGTNGRLLNRSQWPGQRALQGENVTFGTDFLYTSSDGREIWVRVSAVPFRDREGKIKGVIIVLQDIDEQKRSQEALEKIEKIRIKEIHHRIKNNLQVVSSLLDLQAETFSHLEVCKTLEVIEAFMESRSRVISMALIHEELYKGDKIDTLDFAAYLKKLTIDLLDSYNLGNKDISFKLNLEQVYLGMDTAIPLGIIVNELVSNSFKHAFTAGGKGEIRINLRRTETSAVKNNVSGPDEECMEKNGFDYVLEVSDYGKGISQEINFPSADSLGLQLVTILVEQIDSCVKLERDHGTKFTIWFSDVGK